MDQKEEKLSDEAIKSLTELGGVLHSILRRLVSERKAKIVDGKVVFLNSKKHTK